MEKTQRKKIEIVAFAVYLGLFSFFFVKCSEPSSPGLKTKVLNDLFTNFSPEYYYTTEESFLLSHVAKVNIKGFDTWQASMGVIDSLESAEVNMNSMFRIASATKMFTATIILQLWEEGYLKLGTPFNEYLNLDSVNYPKITQFEGVTIRHLLTHRSGVSRISSTTFFDDYFYTDSVSQLEKLRYIFTECDPEFAPGSQYGYRNSNFTILGMVIESVTGSPYHEVLHDRICKPLGLENTMVLDFGIRADDPQLAHGYTRTFDGLHYHGSQAWAAGGLVSSVPDLMKFMEALTNRELYENRATFDLMVSPEAGGHYGMGMFITQTPEGLAYGHSGGIFGYNTRCEYLPELETIVISILCTNGQDFMIVNWYDEFCYPVIAEVRRALSQ